MGTDCAERSYSETMMTLRPPPAQLLRGVTSCSWRAPMSLLPMSMILSSDTASVTSVSALRGWMAENDTCAKNNGNFQKVNSFERILNSIVCVQVAAYFLKSKSDLNGPIFD